VFSPSFLVVIKQPYWLLQDIMNIGLSISLSVTYAIASNKHIAMLSCSWVFLLSLKVGHFSVLILVYLNSHCLENHVDNKEAWFHKSCHQLFHSSLMKILASLKPSMTVPNIVCFPDGHYRKAVYGLRLYITDYTEQALLMCTMQGWCTK
jgi:Plavaka transposase